MNHTPGPWSVDGIGGIQTDGVRDGYMVGSLEHRRIAVMYGGSSVPRNQRWANACLIAAAPDLLDALELLLVKYKYVCKNFAEPFADEVREDASRDEAWVTATNAIKKAKGES